MDALEFIFNETGKSCYRHITTHYEDLMTSIVLIECAVAVVMRIRSWRLDVKGAGSRLPTAGQVHHLSALRWLHLCF